MMAEINKLIWDAGTPATQIGRMNDEAFWRTAAIALRFGVIKRPASGDAFTHEVWDLAHRP